MLHSFIRDFTILKLSIKKCCLKKYFQDSIFSMIYSFSILQQDKESLLSQFLYLLFVEMKYFFFFFQTQFQNLKNNSFLRKKTGNWFHSLRSDSTILRVSSSKIILFEGILSMVQDFNDLFFFQSYHQLSEAVITNLVVSCFCLLNVKFILSFKLNFNFSRVFPFCERNVEIIFIPSSPTWQSF